MRSYNREAVENVTLDTGKPAKKVMTRARGHDNWHSDMRIFNEKIKNVTVAFFGMT